MGLHSLGLNPDSISHDSITLWFCCYVLSDSYNPMDYIPSDSFVHGISQVRILEWVALSFSRGASRPRD